MKTFAQKIIAAGVGVLLITGVSVYGDTLYNNSTTDTGNSLNFSNNWTIGNQIVLGNGFTSASVTNFSFEIYSTNASFAGGASVQMNVFLYANNGIPFNGYATPGAPIYDSGVFPLQTPQQSLGTNAVTLNFDLSLTPVSVPRDFTFAAVVTGLAAGDSVGMELFNPATVGQNYGDFWLNHGSGWTLMTNSVSTTSFGAQFQGTGVPEPSTLGLSIVGASLLIGSFWLRRRQNQSRQG